MSRILSTLPAEYFEFKSVWESVSVKDRTLNLLTERLRLIEMRLPERQVDSTALLAAGKKRFEKRRSNYSNNKSEKSDPKCFYCQELGHFIRNCPERLSVSGK